MISEKALKRPPRPLVMLVLKIWMDHIFQIAMFFTVLTLFGYFFSEALTQWLAVALSLLTFMTLTYLDCWRAGARDAGHAGRGLTGKKPFRGLEAGVISQLPGLILGLAMLLSVSSGLPGIAYRWFYIGAFIPVRALAENFPAARLLPGVISIAICALGYALGRRRIRLVNYVYFKPSKDKQERK